MLKLRNISKSFPGVQALKNVSLEFNIGQVHALCGENGAGKSTLMHIIAGSILPDSGEILWNNRSVSIRDVQQARQLGIAIVYQERTLADSLTVAENIFQANPPRNKIGLIDYQSLHANARQMLDELGLQAIPSTRSVDTLSPAAKQMVEIARALVQEHSLLILDEPTASLTTAETNSLFSIIRKLAKKGTAIIYISHRMAELAAISDIISVLKDGEYQGSFDAKQTATEIILTKMVGRQLLNYKYETHIQKETALEVKKLTGKYFHDISFKLNKGEILGIAGLEGSGRTSLARAIFGDEEIISGHVLKNEHLFKARHPADAIAAGIAYLPEERKGSGLFSTMDIASNIIVTGLNGLWYDKAENNVLAETYRKQLDIKTNSVTTIVQQLSGGNQQKVVIAKWLHTHPDVLIINEPTHGVDIGAKTAIYEILKYLTGTGISILLISSDMPELLLLSDRVMVMYNGEARSILKRSQMTEETITAIATGI